MCGTQQTQERTSSTVEDRAGNKAEQHIGQGKGIGEALVENTGPIFKHRLTDLF